MTIINGIFPNELNAVFDSLEFQESGDLLITELKYSNGNLIVFFKVTYDYNEIPDQYWRIEILDLEKEKVITGRTSQLEAYSNHFLLYEYTDTYIELYFNGIVEDSEKLFVDLYKSHTSNYDENLEFGYGINAPLGMTKLCTYDNGLFARGPFSILEKYASCLKAHNIKTNYINAIDSVTTDLKLLVFGDSYFIAKDFIFTKLEL